MHSDNRHRAVSHTYIMRYSQGRPYCDPPQRDSFYPSPHYHCHTHPYARTLPPALSGRHHGRHRGRHLDRHRGQHRGRHVEEAKVRKAIKQLKLQPWSIPVTKIPGKSSNEEIYREIREWYRRVAKSTLQCSDQPLFFMLASASASRAIHVRTPQRSQSASVQSQHCWTSRRTCSDVV